MLRYSVLRFSKAPVKFYWITFISQLSFEFFNWFEVNSRYFRFFNCVKASISPSLKRAPSAFLILSTSSFLSSSKQETIPLEYWLISKICKVDLQPYIILKMSSLLSKVIVDGRIKCSSFES